MLSEDRAHKFLITFPLFLLMLSTAFLSRSSAANTDVYLPLVIQMPTPTFTATPERNLAQWTKIGSVPGEITSLAIHGEYLYIGDNNRDTQSLYRALITDCSSILPFSKAYANVNNLPYYVNDVAFQGQWGFAATFGISIIYSTDYGNNWTRTKPWNKHDRTYTVAFGNERAFAGNEAHGVIEMDFPTMSWKTIVVEPKNINHLTVISDTLWIGSHSRGVWQWDLVTNGLTELNHGLRNGLARNVWDFEFDDSDAVFVATEDGVFRNNGTEPWQEFGLNDVRVRSLALQERQLFAGSIGQGVWQRDVEHSTSWLSVEQGDGWNNQSTVRDLLYDPTHCQGLLAATSDGVWVLR